MDKELVVLQKQINLHVNDIERYQGFVRKLAVQKGTILEELRRDKEKARKTNKQLKSQKETETGSATVMAAAGKSIMSNSTQAFAEGSPVEVLLFGFKARNNMVNSSFNASIGSDASSTSQHVASSLKHLIKTQNLVSFSIATSGDDGRRIYNLENLKAAGGYSKAPHDVVLQTKI